MKPTIPQTEWQNNHSRNSDPVTFDGLFTTTGDMQVSNSKPALWAAVLALMEKHYGQENLNRLARDVKIGPATASRLKAQETSVGIDTIDKLADYFRVEPWQLLLPGFNPDNPQTLAAASPMARDVAEKLDAMTDEDRRRAAYALILQIIEFGAVPVLGKEPERSASPTPKPHPHE